MPLFKIKLSENVLIVPERRKRKSRRRSRRRSRT
jgi:hypothetical protein